MRKQVDIKRKIWFNSQVPEVLYQKYVGISSVLVIHVKLLALLAINVEKNDFLLLDTEAHLFAYFYWFKTETNTKNPSKFLKIPAVTPKLHTKSVLM